MLEAERRRLEDVNMQLLLKLENITMTMTDVTVGKETSLFAELEMLSQSLSVDSFSNQPARPVTIATQVLSCPAQTELCSRRRLMCLLVFKFVVTISAESSTCIFTRATLC